MGDPGSFFKNASSPLILFGNAYLYGKHYLFYILFMIKTKHLKTKL